MTSSFRAHSVSWMRYLFVVAGVAALGSFGCIKIHLGTSVGADATGTNEIILAISKQASSMMAGMGATPSNNPGPFDGLQESVAQLPSAWNATIKPWSDDSYEGRRVQLAFSSVDMLNEQLAWMATLASETSRRSSSNEAAEPSDTPHADSGGEELPGSGDEARTQTQAAAGPPLFRDFSATVSGETLVLRGTVGEQSDPLMAGMAAAMSSAFGAAKPVLGWSITLPRLIEATHRDSAVIKDNSITYTFDPSSYYDVLVTGSLVEESSATMIIIGLIVISVIAGIMIGLFFRKVA